MKYRPQIQLSQVKILLALTPHQQLMITQTLLILPLNHQITAPHKRTPLLNNQIIQLQRHQEIHLMSTQIQETLNDNPPRLQQSISCWSELNKPPRIPTHHLKLTRLYPHQLIPQKYLQIHLALQIIQAILTQIPLNQLKIQLQTQLQIVPITTQNQ